MTEVVLFDFCMHRLGCEPTVWLLGQPAPRAQIKIYFCNFFFI